MATPEDLRKSARNRLGTASASFAKPTNTRTYTPSIGTKNAPTRPSSSGLSTFVAPKGPAGGRPVISSKGPAGGRPGMSYTPSTVTGKPGRRSR